MELFLKNDVYVSKVIGWTGHEAFQLEWLVRHASQFLRHIFLTYNTDTENIY